MRSTARGVLKITTRSAAAFLAGCALFGFNPQALAATDAWVGSTSNNWADSNWNASGNNPPQSGDSLVFGAAGLGTTLVDNLMTPATYTINGITFNSGAAAYTITSGTVGVNGFTLAGPLTNASASLQTISDGIALSGQQTFGMTGGGSLTFSGPISGTGGITESGTGTITLSGSSSYTGNTLVSISNMTITGTVGSLATPSGAFTGTDTFTGSTVVSGGTLVVGNSNALLDSTVNYNNQGGTLEFGSVSSATFGALNGAQSLLLTNTNSTGVALTIGGNSSYSGGFTGLGSVIIGTGTTTLSGASTYAGTTTVENATLNLTGAIGSSGSPAGAFTVGQSVNVSASPTLSINGGTLYASSYTQDNGATGGGGTATVVTISNGANVVISGAASINASNGDDQGYMALTGGTFTANSLTISRDTGNLGTSGVTSGDTTDGLYVNGGALIVTNNLQVAGSNSRANMRMDSGSVTVGGTTLISDLGGTRMTVLDIDGGVFTDNDT